MTSGLLLNNTVPTPSSSFSVASLDASGLDPESRVMAICSSMLSLLEKRMDEHMKLMENRNKEADKLRGLLQNLNTALDQFEVGAKPNATVSIKSSNQQKVSALLGVQEALQASGISELTNLAPDGVFRKGDLDLAVSSVTGMLDSKTQIQQKDTFTLQALFGRRNEAYEMMSNVFKKCQDSRSAINRNI